MTPKLKFGDPSSIEWRDRSVLEQMVWAAVAKGTIHPPHRNGLHEKECLECGEVRDVHCGRPDLMEVVAWELVPRHMAYGAELTWKCGACGEKIQTYLDDEDGVSFVERLEEEFPSS